MQTIAFNEEIEILSKKGELPRSNKLIVLSTFIDENGILRVGTFYGRLKRSRLPYNMKHKILLPYKKKSLISLLRMSTRNACMADRRRRNPLYDKISGS